MVTEALELEQRLHTISGRVAQLDMNLRTCCDDLTGINASLKRLKVGLPLPGVRWTTPAVINRCLLPYAY